MNTRFLVCALLLGCSNAEAAVEPVWGKQPCDHCHMLLSDPQNAAQLVTKEGERLYFDDVGCMLERLAWRAGSVAHVWVRDANGSWIDAERAHYRSGANTPMGYGVQVSSDGALDFASAQREVGNRHSAERAP
jgi:nitrous oxide reductase accessory protein NosL